MNNGEHRAGRVVAVVSLLYGLHSLLAWNRVKAAARRRLGRRYDPGVYRFGYVVVSALSSLAGLAWFLRQPDRTIYRLRWPWSLLGRAVQLGGGLVLLDLLRVVGAGRLLGVAQTLAALRGRVSPPTPEAQGPRLGRDGAVEARGLFRHMRHPDNLPAVLLFAGFPHMTWNRLALALTTLAYAVVGSLHEDVRLRQAYGAPFVAYQRSVPLMLPRLARRRAGAAGAGGGGPASAGAAAPSRAGPGRLPPPWPGTT